MKDYIKRAVALLAAAMMASAISVSAFAATSAPATARPRSAASSQNSSLNDDDEDSSSSSRSSADDDEEDEDSSSSSRSSSDDDEEDASSTTKSATKATQAPQAQTQPPVVTEAPQSAAVNKSYTTKGGAFLWFLLSIIVNTIISFAIAKRFYKLAKKSNHVQSEIRALRRDIEEKFAQSIDGFTEPALDITNTNDDYSSSEDGIKMTPSAAGSSDPAETEDVYKEWEAQFAKRRAERREALKRPYTPEPEYEDEIDEYDIEDEDAPRRSSKKFQPSRKASKAQSSIKDRIAKRRAASEDNDDIVEDDDDVARAASGIGAKAKQLLSGIFPMDDDDE